MRLRARAYGFFLGGGGGGVGSKEQFLKGTQIQPKLYCEDRCVYTVGCKIYICKKKNLNIFWICLIIIRRYFAECVIVLISHYRGQPQFLIFFIFCVLSSYK